MKKLSEVVKRGGKPNGIFEYVVVRDYTPLHPHYDNPLRYGSFGPYYTVEAAKKDGTKLARVQPKEWFLPGFRVVQHFYQQ